MRVEDALQTAIYKNKKLEVKDETYTGIFECLKDLLKNDAEFNRYILMQMSNPKKQ